MTEQPRPDKPATQWQCTCGKWIDVGWSHHPHIETEHATLAEMHAMRRAQESGLSGIVPDALERETKITKVFRTKEMPVR